MTFIVEFEFEIGDRVNIKDIKTLGYVIGLYFSSTGRKYQIAYFYDGEMRTEYLFPFQIETTNTIVNGFISASFGGAHDKTVSG